MIKSIRASSKTLTEVAEQELRKAILNGEYPPGSQLPSEAELIDLLGVSRTTIREALRSLEDGGIVLRRHGVGTFVLERPIVNNFGVNIGVEEMIRFSNMIPGTREVSISEESAGNEVAMQLGITPESSLVVIERVHTANGNPIVYSMDYLSLALLGGKNITEEMLNAYSLYDLLQIEFNLVIEYGVAKIKPINANIQVANKLSQKKNDILLFVTQTDFLSNDKPIVYSHQYNLPNAFNYMFLRRRPLKS